MPYKRPTLTELNDSVASAINAKLPGVDAQLRFSYLGVLARSQAGLAHLHFGYLDFIATQAVPFTCGAEYLEAWAALKGVVRRAARPATASVTFSGTAGGLVPAATLIVRSDGYKYTTTSAATVSAGVVVVPVVAVADQGAGNLGNVTDGNAAQGQRMVLAQSIPGIASSGTVIASMPGENIESDTALRARMIAAFQTPPQAGAASDYLAWATACPDVTRAWITPHGYGVGTVLIYVMFDILREASQGLPQGANGVATLESRGQTASGDQLGVANAIYQLQPCVGLVYVSAPLLKVVNLSVQGLAASLQPALFTAIGAVLREKGTPGGRIDFGLIWGAVATLAAGAAFVLTPATDIVCGKGEIPVLGTLSRGGA